MYYVLCIIYLLYITQYTLCTIYCILYAAYCILCLISISVLYSCPYTSFSLLFTSCRGPSSVKTLDVAELVAEVNNWPLEHNLQP